MKGALVVQIATIYVIDTNSGANVAFTGRTCTEDVDVRRPIPTIIIKGDKKIVRVLPDNGALFYPKNIVDRCICFHCCIFRDDMLAYNAPQDWPCCSLVEHNKAGSTFKQIRCTKRNPYYFLHNLTRKYRLLYLSAKDQIPLYE